MALNPEQLEAVNSNERTILCLAAAGSGKTHTLLARIERLVNDGVDPRSILALTFTNAAAFEMKDRYKRNPNVNSEDGVPEFRTFHSFCYSLIIKDLAVRSKLGYSKVPEICDDNQIKEIKTKVQLQLGIKLAEAKWNGEEPLSRKEEDEKALLNKALIKEIKKQNVITFDIMCYNVCELFVKDDPVVAKYKEKYKHVFVDESQDCDAKQFRFVGSFPETTSTFLVGDILQNIYGFRGCTNEFIKKLTSMPGWKIIKLYINYRSTNQICDYANKFSSYSRDEFRIPMKGTREGDPVETVWGANFSTYDEPVDTEHIHILINKLQENKAESAILCRTNKECECIKKALEKEGIQFSARTKSTDALNILRGSLSNEFMLDWLPNKLDPKDYSDYIRMSSQIPDTDIHWFLDKYGNRTSISNAVDKIIKIRNIAGEDISQEEKFNKIAAVVRVKSKCEFLGNENSTNKEIVESIRDQVQEMQDAQVYVGTIHSSKGLEYENVYVMGVDTKMFQLGSEEMNNLFYVAVTRAKNHLVVFRH